MSMANDKAVKLMENNYSTEIQALHARIRSYPGGDNRTQGVKVIPRGERCTQGVKVIPRG